MLRLFLGILLMVGCCCGLNTLTYSFAAQATSTYQRPSYNLGYLNALTAISISINLPDTSSYNLSPANFYIAITDSANQAIIKSFTGGSGSCPASNACVLQWTVDTQGSYFLQIYANSAAIETTMLVRYNLMVTANGAQILKASDVLRQHVIKFFYLATSTPVTITQWPVSSSNCYPTILTMNTGNKFSVAATMQPPSTSTNGQSSTYVVNLVAGYFAIIVNTDVTLSVTISFQSDSYTCPFTADYPDLFAIFQGCTPSVGVTAAPGLPCLTFDNVFNRCLNCMDGYSVGSNGACQLGGNCTSRQYFHFGACTDVSPNCGTFDPSTGDCTTCANSSYILQFGQCIMSIVSLCNPDQYLLNSRCVPKSCGNYDPNTGNCLACISPAYFLNGTQCYPVICDSKSYFSLVTNVCRPIPNGCMNFSVAVESCQSCGLGYTLVSGVCQGTSPEINCNSYNAVEKLCFNCSVGYNLSAQGLCVSTWSACPQGQSLVNGMCVATPVVPVCAFGQYAVNGNCTVLPPNCASLNSIYYCTSCQPGYTLLRGSCQLCTPTNPAYPCVSCPPNKYVDVTGKCSLPSPFCQTFSQASGWCITCTNGVAPVSGVCCAEGFTVMGGLCMKNSIVVNPSSKTPLKDRFPNCLIYSPATDTCTQCLPGHMPSAYGCQ